MAKLKLGTIGTSWITDSFIEGALRTNQYDLTIVYSRTSKKGEKFASKYESVSVETDLNVFMNHPDLDVIYIASPNSLHYEQTLLALEAGKHVIVEKPASINPKEWKKMLDIAQNNHVFVFEAARHLHDPNFIKMKNEVHALGKIQGATLAFAKYSSKYDQVLEGEEPNIFSPKFAGGVLMDLGIYPIYTAVALFGEPVEVHYFSRKIQTNVDGIGTVILEYDTFDVTILMSKISSSLIGMEFYGKKETLIVDHATNVSHMKRLDAKSFNETEIPLKHQEENNMIYEAKVFAQMIKDNKSEAVLKKYYELSEIARIVTSVLYELRMKTGLIYPFEKSN